MGGEENGLWTALGKAGGRKLGPHTFVLTLGVVVREGPFKKERSGKSSPRRGVAIVGVWQGEDMRGLRQKLQHHHN